MAAGVKIRLNSFLARCGVGSRRACEKLILAGEVAIDGHTIRELGTVLDPASQTVRVRGRKVVPATKTYLAFHKPAGCLCSREGHEASDKTIYDHLPRKFGKLFYVGRLDRDTEGLLFLTNDGDWAQAVAHPRHGARKIYVAEVRGRLAPEQLRRACAGVRDEGEILKAERVRVLGRGSRSGTSRIEVVLAEGKKREIRRLFRALGAPVIHLKRMEIGGVRLGLLKPGEWRLLNPAEIRRFD